MGIYDLNLKQKKQLRNVKYVTRLAKRRLENTILNRGTTGTETRAFTTAQRWSLKGSQTTKFIQSQPIVTVSNGQEPPF